MPAEAKPHLVLVGADKGGVGKTMTTRALLSYCIKRGIVCRVIDTEASDRSLRRFHPEAEAIDMGRVAGQMRIFDDLPNAGVTVVDVRAGLLTAALKAMHAAGMFADIAAGRLDLVVLHVVDANVASLAEMAPVSAQLAEGGDYFVIKNQIAEERFGGADDASYRQYFDHLGVRALIDIPHLDAMAAKAIDRDGVSFLDFAHNHPPRAERSVWLSKLTMAWLIAVWTAFDAAKLETALRS